MLRSLLSNYEFHRLIPGYQATNKMPGSTTMTLVINLLLVLAAHVQHQRSKCECRSARRIKGRRACIDDLYYVLYSLYCFLLITSKDYIWYCIISYIRYFPDERHRITRRHDCLTTATRTQHRSMSITSQKRSWRLFDSFSVLVSEPELLIPSCPTSHIRHWPPSC